MTDFGRTGHLAERAAQSLRGGEAPISEVAVLTVPGYTGAGPSHWMTLWEREHAHFTRVEQAEWDNPTVDTWVGTLEDTIRRQVVPVVLVAHSCGAATVAHWASRCGTDQVRGALLVAPPDADSPDVLDAVRTFAPLPRSQLPFPSVLVASDDDPHLSLRRAARLAQSWGSRLEIVPGAGHLNTASGHGPWPEGERLLADLLDPGGRFVAYGPRATESGPRPGLP